MLSKSDFVFSTSELKTYLGQKGINMNKAGMDVKHPFFMMVPKYYLDLIDWNDNNDPLRKMVITSSLENDIKKYELTDPIGDRPHTPVPGIVHRYQDRCLLMLSNVCAVHCRFCFRKNLLNSNTYDFKKSIEYIKKHKEIWEVILSGGDPFMMEDIFLQKIITALKQIKHIKMIRFHTRTPAVYPKRITDDFVKIISQAKPSIIVFHINHPREITPEFIQSVAKLKKTSSILLSQTVLLKGVNDNTQTLTRLFKSLVEIGIKPYYLHHLDYTVGTDYFRISVEEGKKIYRELSSISGHCIPEYVIDIPGGLGKIPVFWFNHVGKNKYQATDFAGKKVVYSDPS
ncbi:KamA family radical SAM protein [Candidatus Gottesmanbacteria bacterium]|nr:KamA family radical SAM protein [Candidatus Gottesmanbacteria bacterium]